MTAEKKDSSEAFQIAIFTCVFVGGGLALITLVLAFFMNPSAAEEVTRVEGDYRKLSDLLQNQEMKLLRQQAKVTEGKDSSKLTLKEILFETQKSFGLEFQRFTDTKPVTQAGIEVVRQPVELKPAAMRPILQFMATVKEAKKSIRVEQIRLEKKRAKDTENDDSWIATIDFVDYVGK